ncbi:MAG TPA: prepilin peptidase [bacterium]|nr:prepilin peptidase [bacterium]
MPLLAYYLMPLLLVAGCYDLGWRRIPNALTLPLAGTGLVLQGLCGAGWVQALLSLALGGGIFFLFYLGGMIGAGDVKLMAGAAVWLDPAAAAGALVWTAASGGFLALVMMALQALRIRRGTAPAGKESGLATATLPYGVAIALGTMLSFCQIR